MAVAKTTKKPTRTAAAKTTSTPAKVKRVAAEKGLFSLGGLFNLNKWFALFYAAAALAVGLFGSALSVPLQWSYLAKDELLSTNSDPVFGFATTEVASVNIVWLLAAWLALLAVVHILLATKLRGLYEREVVRGGNTVGWLTGGVLFGYGALIVALLVGGYDVSILALALLASVGAGIAGWLATRTGVQLRAGLALASLLGALPWLVVILLVAGSLIYGSAALPVVAYVVAGTGAVMGLALGVITWLGYAKKGAFAKPVATEALFTIVTFVFVLALAGEIFAGYLW